MDISLYKLVFSKNKIPNPEKYNSNIAEDNNNCVKGSVEGVKIAPIMVDINIIYLHPTFVEVIRYLIIQLKSE
jgi:hypothetical protein